MSRDLCRLLLYQSSTRLLELSAYLGSRLNDVLTPIFTERLVG